MRFNPRARLDTSRVEEGGDGGGSTGGGGGIPIPLPGGRAGGGIGTLIILVLLFVLGQCTGIGPQISGGTGDGTTVGTGTFGGVQAAQGAADTGDYAQCKTGADANESSDCALVAVENSLVKYWSKQPQLASRFQPENAIDIFSNSVSTGGCGNATSAVGPFYCPGDRTIYIDPTFFEDIFKQLGGKDTTFVRAYVIAHEYGHHIQNLLGTMSQVKTQQGPDSDAVRLELQADCYAGMWAAAAVGDGFVQDITDQDISEGIGAAQTVGDDHIQETTSGGTNPSQYTHGTSAERVAWFKQGMKTPDDIKGCDTFSSNDLDTP